MVRIKSYARGCLVALLAFPLLASACRARDDDKKKAEEQRERLNAESTFDVAQTKKELQLAVEVAVRADGVQAVGAKIIRAPAPSDSAIADLRVTARAGARTVAEYDIRDPRLAEVDRREGAEGGGLRVLPEGRVFVFAPLSAELTEIQIAPSAGREREASKGGTIDARALAFRACQEKTDIEECQQILKAQPPPSPSPSPPRAVG